MAGRPTIFTPELGEELCTLIAEGQSLRKICVLTYFPHISTVMDWVLKGEAEDERYKAFAQQYNRACEMRLEYWAEEIIDIADNDKEEAHRSRLKVDSRKWLMSKLKPKKYGEKVTQDHNIGGQPDNPLKFEGKITIELIDPLISHENTDSA